ncbi:YgjP-like metallopeptidase domain-containing protein [Burkholderia sp. 1B3(2022)]|uniref:YgjP-like metallopeptidase domain-containing protein n=1 Tax=Burkholderia sp. 1B3(2022) TaxID=2997425 RepID=UPI003FA53652
MRAQLLHRGQALSYSVDAAAGFYCVALRGGVSMEGGIDPDALAPLLEGFYQERAEEKLLSRVRHWERETGLRAAGACIRHFQSRWASCDAANILQFHPRVMELAGSVQDYIIVHELCHTVEKNHTRAFWCLVAQFMPGWRREHEALERVVHWDAI